jgi:hypothetical protein
MHTCVFKGPVQVRRSTNSIYILCSATLRNSLHLYSKTCRWSFLSSCSTIVWYCMCVCVSWCNPPSQYSASRLSKLSLLIEETNVFKKSLKYWIQQILKISNRIFTELKISDFPPPPVMFGLFGTK